MNAVGLASQKHLLAASLGSRLLLEVLHLLRRRLYRCRKERL